VNQPITKREAQGSRAAVEAAVELARDRSSTWEKRVISARQIEQWTPLDVDTSHRDTAAPAGTASDPSAGAPPSRNLMTDASKR
jgi:hypothetical protein